MSAHGRVRAGDRQHTGRNGDQPTVMTPTKIGSSRPLYERADLTVFESAKTLGVTRASIDRPASSVAG